MRGYFPSNVSEYTKQQCEEYLASYPNGLKAESVRERLNLLSPKPKPATTTNTLDGDDEYCVKHHGSLIELKNYQNKYPNGKHVEECRSLLCKPENINKTTTKTESTDGTGVWVVIIVVIVFIGVFILAILTWEYLYATFPILAGIIGIVWVIKSIFFND